MCHFINPFIPHYLHSLNTDIKNLVKYNIALNYVLSLLESNMLTYLMFKY